MKAPSVVAASTLVATLFFCGCNRDIQNKEAVREGVVKYLAKRPDLTAMDVSVTAVSFRDNQATANVHFQAKGNNSQAAGMSLTYILEKKGSEWVVKGRSGADMHGAQPGVQGMPPGHPSVGDGSSGAMPAMPPGHPPINPGQTPGPGK
jgi:hypothetical protein